MRFFTGFCRFAEKFYRTENFSLYILCSLGGHLQIDTKIMTIGALRQKLWLQEKRVRGKIFLTIITSPPLFGGPLRTVTLFAGAVAKVF